MWNGKSEIENAEADEQQQDKCCAARSAGICRRGRCLQSAKIKTARGLRHAAIEHDQAEQQNETAEREIDRDFPGGGVPIAAPQIPMSRNVGMKRELVKGVEEKQIERSECADGAAGNEEQAGVESVFVLRDFAGEPDRGERDDRGQQQHDQTQTIDAEGEVDPPIALIGKRADELKTALRRYRNRESSSSCREQRKRGGPERSPSRGRAEQDRERGHDRSRRR